MGRPSVSGSTPVGRREVVTCSHSAGASMGNGGLSCGYVPLSVERAAPSPRRPATRPAGRQSSGTRPATTEASMNGYPQIADHGMIGDLQTAALVSSTGTVDWWCTPRFDSPSVFASLLDTER